MVGMSSSSSCVLNCNCVFSATGLSSKVSRLARPVAPLRKILPVIKAQQAPEPGRRATLVGLGSAAFLLSTTANANAAVVDDYIKKNKDKELKLLLNEDTIAGGWTTVDPTDPDVVKVAKFAVTEHNKEAGTRLSYISVVKAEIQVVAGLNYRLVISAKDEKTGKTNDYTAIVWAQLDGSFQLVSFEEGQSKKLVGGWTPIPNLSDPEVLRVAKFAVAEHNKESGSNLEFLSVIQGETQVVSGINYRLVISAKDSSTGKSGKYVAIVWSKPWEKDFLKLISFEEYLGGALGRPGGYTPIENPNDHPEIVNIAKFAVAEHNKEAGVRLEYVAIIKGYVQVVAGLNYKLVIIAKDAATNKYNVYEAIVYSKPWEKILQLTSFQELLQA